MSGSHEAFGEVLRGDEMWSQSHGGQNILFTGGCAVEQGPPKCVWTAILMCNSGTGWERSSEGCNMQVNQKPNAITFHQTTVPDQFSFKFLSRIREWRFLPGQDLDLDGGIWPWSHWDVESRVAHPQSAAFTGTSGWALKKTIFVCVSFAPSRICTCNLSKQQNHFDC